MTLPGLKARGFLDQRAALNRRVPIYDAAKNGTILNRESVKTKFLVNSRQTQRAVLLRRLTTYWKCLIKSVSLPFVWFRCAPPYRFIVHSDCSGFTHQLLIDDWVFKEDFPFPLDITTLRSISYGSLSRLSLRFFSLYLS